MIYNLVTYFEVNEFIPHASDHCSITVTLSTNYLMDTSSSVEYEYIQKPKKIPWSESTSNSFEQIIQSAKYKALLSQIHMEHVSSQESIDSAVERLSSYLTNAALQAAGPAAGVSRPTIPCRSTARN